MFMRVDLRNPCVNTACTETTSCLAQGTTKACIDATLDLSTCEEGCSESDLLVQNQESFAPCSEEENPCAAYAACVALEGRALCVCETGHVATDSSCVSLAGCEDSGDSCHDDAVCKQTSLGFSYCDCRSGYEGDGRICMPIAIECEPECGAHATCFERAPRSFECACDSGYESGAEGCEDIDECVSAAACPPGFSCDNEAGAFTCRCDLEDASAACDCPAGYQESNGGCGDVDECELELDDCHENASCNNVPGGFECSCEAGYDGDGTTCADVNECELELHDCDENASCDNTAGGFECSCEAGYDGDGTTCADVNECDLGSDDCDENAACENTTGSFECSCDLGYDGDGESCADVDECELGSDDCDENAACENTTGSFACTCDPGYSGDGTSCTEILCAETSVNYALASAGSVASAQTTFASYSPANVIDGDTTTAQLSTESWANESVGLPQWFDIEFGVSRTFSHVDVYTSVGYEIQNYDIEYWTGSEWATLVTVTGNTSAVAGHDFPRVSSDRLRVLCRRGPEFQSSYVRLNEVQVSCE
jgi:hypothetical protein